MDARVKPAHDDVLVYGSRLCGAALKERCTASGTRFHSLTKTAHGLIAAPMINAATIVIARRRRSYAVRAALRVKDLRV
jgi:hypothetical protein